MQDASIARLSYVGASIVGTHATMHSGAITINTNTPPSPIETEIQGQRIKVPLKKFGAVIGPNSHIGVHSSLRPGTIVHENIIIDPHKIISGNITTDQL
jgi:NDP-sugar pyrophosphorylase family protein